MTRTEEGSEGENTLMKLLAIPLLRRLGRFCIKLFILLANKVDKSDEGELCAER